MSNFKIGMKEANYKYAGYWPRMWAYNTDLLFLLVAFYLLSLVVHEDRALYIACFVLTVLYHALFECSSWKATPGKKILHLEVINESGASLNFWQAIIRFFLKIISLLLLYIGFIMIGLTRKGQGLHDKIAKTLVINQAQPEV